MRQKTEVASNARHLDRNAAALAWLAALADMAASRHALHPWQPAACCSCLWAGIIAASCPCYAHPCQSVPGAGHSQKAQCREVQVLTSLIYVDLLPSPGHNASCWQPQKNPGTPCRAWSGSRCEKRHIGSCHLVKMPAVHVHGSPATAGHGTGCHAGSSAAHNSGWTHWITADGPANPSQTPS